MALKRAYANVELLDGTIAEDLRITLPDRLDLERTMKARNWGERDSFTVAAYLAWRAMIRLKLYAGTWDEFLADAVDVQLDDTAEGEPDPTTSRAGH